MTVNELINALTAFRDRGYGERAVTQYARKQLDFTETHEVTGVFADDDGEEVILETVSWTAISPAPADRDG